MPSKPPKFPHLDLNQYVSLTEAMTMLSGLFSESGKPYIPYRFAENLFVYCLNSSYRITGSNVSRQDNSFDSLICLPNGDRVGVGVKTFIKRNRTYNDEKVAEFTKYAGNHNLKSQKDEDLMLEVADLRNKRVTADINSLGLQTGSFYHCLVRDEGCFFIHEEPYPLIDINSLRLVPAKKGQGKGTIHFEDNTNYYTYSTAKNVLFKRFKFNAEQDSRTFPVKIANDSFAFLTQLLSGIQSNKALQKLLLTKKKTTTTMEFVVLPLYSSRGPTPKVPDKSGLNQWNADGRPREFGEAYFPVPRAVLKERKGFFPTYQGNGKEECQSFTLKLPNGKTSSAKLCQQGLKALMTHPNVDLAEWIYSIIDGSFEKAQERLNAENKELNRPYTYSDLEKIEKDCVYVFKEERGVYSVEFAPFGAFEVFKELGYKKMLLADFEEHLESSEEEED